MPAGTVSALAKDLDEHSRYIGCPNGVLDLNSGTLLRGDAAREKLVTRSVPDPYVPTARHEAVDAMLAHLTDENREWVLDALGYALRGNPARRIYVLEGPARRGKDDSPERSAGLPRRGEDGWVLIHDDEERSGL